MIDQKFKAFKGVSDKAVHLPKVQEETLLQGVRQMYFQHFLVVSRKLIVVKSPHYKFYQRKGKYNPLKVKKNNKYLI